MAARTAPSRGRTRAPCTSFRIRVMAPAYVPARFLPVRSSSTSTTKGRSWNGTRTAADCPSPASTQFSISTMMGVSGVCRYMAAMATSMMDRPMR